MRTMLRYGLFCCMVARLGLSSSGTEKSSRVRRPLFQNRSWCRRIHKEGIRRRVFGCARESFEDVPLTRTRDVKNGSVELEARLDWTPCFQLTDFLGAWGQDGLSQADGVVYHGYSDEKNMFVPVVRGSLTFCKTAGNMWSLRLKFFQKFDYLRAETFDELIEIGPKKLSITRFIPVNSLYTHELGSILLVRVSHNQQKKTAMYTPDAHLYTTQPMSQAYRQLDVSAQVDPIGILNNEKQWQKTIHNGVAVTTSLLWELKTSIERRIQLHGRYCTNIHFTQLVRTNASELPGGSEYRYRMPTLDCIASVMGFVKEPSAVMTIRIRRQAINCCYDSSISTFEDIVSKQLLRLCEFPTFENDGGCPWLGFLDVQTDMTAYVHMYTLLLTNEVIKRVFVRVWNFRSRWVHTVKRGEYGTSTSQEADEPVNIVLEHGFDVIPKEFLNRRLLSSAFCADGLPTVRRNKTNANLEPGNIAVKRKDLLFSAKFPDNCTTIRRRITTQFFFCVTLLTIECYLTDDNKNSDQSLACPRKSSFILTNQRFSLDTLLTSDGRLTNRFPVGLSNSVTVRNSDIRRHLSDDGSFLWPNLKCISCVINSTTNTTTSKPNAGLLKPQLMKVRRSLGPSDLRSETICHGNLENERSRKYQHDVTSKYRCTSGRKRSTGRHSTVLLLNGLAEYEYVTVSNHIKQLHVAEIRVSSVSILEYLLRHDYIPDSEGCQFLRVNNGRSCYDHCGQIRPLAELTTHALYHETKLTILCVPSPVDPPVPADKRKGFYKKRFHICKAGVSRCDFDSKNTQGLQRKPALRVTCVLSGVHMHHRSWSDGLTQRDTEHIAYRVAFEYCVRRIFTSLRIELLLGWK
ncbi:hypothetical protein CLF_103725, partial [Clonorchis sinensis]